MTAPTVVMPNDGFSTYFAERLWDMIPATYRHEDGIAPQPGVLRAIVELIAEQAAVLRRSEDRLWEDQFAELCDDWALPYIADLVGARLVGALDARARRVVVAKTIHYRRRAGTMGLLEQLVLDVTGWDASIVEQFRRLGRARHLLDPAPARESGRITRTPPGGWADLRSPRIEQLLGGPADEASYTPDMRRHRGEDGRFAIHKLAVFLFRIGWFEMHGVMPVDLGGGSFTFDPAGRDIPLFAPRGRPDHPDGYRQAREYELAAPITCRVLGEDVYEITESVILALLMAGIAQATAARLRVVFGVRIAGESALQRLVLLTAPILAAGPIFTLIRDTSLVDDCGSVALLGRDVPVGSPLPPAAMRITLAPGGAVRRSEILAANLSGAPPIPPAGRTVGIDPAIGRFVFFAGALPAATTVSVDYYYGFSGPIGAGPYDRRDADEGIAAQTPAGGGAITAAHLPLTGLSRILDSATYSPIASLTGIADLTFVAAHAQRPYLRLDADWVLDSGAVSDARLRLDGLWIGSGIAGRRVILRGDFESVTIDRCTIDPGSLRSDGTLELPPVAILIEGHVEKLTIMRSIVGPVIADGANAIVESLAISDSIVQSIDPAVAAIVVGASPSAQGVQAGEATLRDVTVFGEVAVHRLWACGALIAGLVTVVDSQRGCFRFSAAHEASTLPPRYDAFLFVNDPTDAFTSQRFGDPGFAQLTEGAPFALRRGGEDGIEMGAFASLGTPRKLDGLAAKLEEFLPFGLVPIYIPRT